MLIPTAIAEHAGDFSALRRDLHAHPELGFSEQRTSQLVAQALLDCGFEVHEGIGQTGVVGVLRKGTSGKTIGLRADMDALPMQELNAFEHASVHPGRMHACGHDGHTATLLAAAHYLARHGDFDGTVVLMFQPAEESGAGARAMLDDGVLERFPMEVIFGAHNWPGLTVGQFAVRSGPMTAGSADFALVVRGQGGHAAAPHLANDPILAACQLVQTFQSILPRHKSPAESAILSVTVVKAGEANNVIPDQCEVRGTVRAFSADLMHLVEERMHAMISGVCAAFGVTFDFSFVVDAPPTCNHPEATAFLRQTICELAGEDAVLDFEPTMGAEDFGCFLEKIPGCYFAIGNGDGAHRSGNHGLGPCQLHNGSYDFNDELIPLGATLWVRLVERWLAPMSETCL